MGDGWIFLLKDRIDYQLPEHHNSEAYEETVDTQTNSYVTGDPAFAVDQRGLVVLWNEAAEDSFGYTAPQALGRKCWRLLSGKDTFGNRYCCRHCPIREMAFRNEPVNSFQSVYKTSGDEANLFAVSCLTISDQLGQKVLLHICRPEQHLPGTNSTPIPPNPPAKKHPDTLSQREIEVLKLLSEKMSTQDIAETLSISIRTVRTHIQHLMYKLQVHKRIEAIKVGKQLNLI